MAILFGGSRVNDRMPPPTGLRIQTSLDGQPIAIVYGRQRIAGNLVWYDGFKSSGGGGKGGGKGGIAGGGKGQSRTKYSADVIIGLCEGPVGGIGTIWSGQSLETAAKLGITFFAGATSQAPWSFMTTSFPGNALGYSDLAYAGANPLSLGGSPSLPSLNFEIDGVAAGAVTESYTIASPYNFTPAHFTLASSVVERAIIPATAPYQIQAQNPTAKTEILVAGGGVAASSVPGSQSQGVVDANGRVFARVTASPASGEYTIAKNAHGWIYTFAAADAGLAVTLIDLAVAPGVVSDGVAFEQVLGTPGRGQFSLSVQPGSFGQYRFAAADSGATVTITDVPDADPAGVLSDFLTNGRYGCGLPTANIGDLSALQNYSFANGLFISPALVASRAASDFLDDFATGLNGEFVWSSGFLSFVPYGDSTIAGFGKTYSPPAAPIYALTDDDFLKNEGGAGIGASAFSGDDPVICIRSRPSDADNDVKIEYVDRGNSYNPAIAEAQDDAAINAFGLRVADRKQLHFFCGQEPALTSAQLQLARRQARNLYTFTVPWYFILLDPMDIVAISDTALGLAAQWVRIREITENQQDGSLTISAEEYVPGAGTTPPYGGQNRAGYTPNINTPASGIN